MADSDPADPAPHVLRRLLGIPAEIVVALFILADAIIAPLFRPIMRWLSRLGLIRRLERTVGAMPPYLILGLLVVPFAIAELAKVLGVFLMGTGHFHSGMTIFIGAYVVSILVCERTFHAGKGQLMTIPWFAKSFDWLMSVRDHVLVWLRKTRIWSFAGAARQKVRLTSRRVVTRLHALFGPKPRGVFGAKPRGVFERR